MVAFLCEIPDGTVETTGEDILILIPYLVLVGDLKVEFGGRRIMRNVLETIYFWNWGGEHINSEIMHEI